MGIVCNLYEYSFFVNCEWSWRAYMWFERGGKNATQPKFDQQLLPRFFIENDKNISKFKAYIPNSSRNNLETYIYISKFTV